MGPHTRRTCLRSNEALVVVVVFTFAPALTRNSQGIPPPTRIPTLAHFLFSVFFKPTTTISTPLTSSRYHNPPPTGTFSRRPRLLIRTAHPGRGPILARDLSHAPQ